MCNHIGIFKDQVLVPKVLGGISFEKVQHYNSPGAGCSLKYYAVVEDRYWFNCSVYIYDKGKKLDNNVHSSDVLVQFEASVANLKNQQIQRGDPDIELIQTRYLELTPGSDTNTWLWGAFKHIQNNDSLVTHLSVRVEQGYFVKVLLTYPLPIDDLGKNVVINVLDDLKQAINK